MTLSVPPTVKVHSAGPVPKHAPPDKLGTVVKVMELPPELTVPALEEMLNPVPPCAETTKTSKAVAEVPVKTTPPVADPAPFVGDTVTVPALPTANVQKFKLYPGEWLSDNGVMTLAVPAPDVAAELPAAAAMPGFKTARNSASAIFVMTYLIFAEQVP